MKKGNHPLTLANWVAEKQKQRANRALDRQLDYQEKKAEALKGQERETFFKCIAEVCFN